MFDPAKTSKIFFDLSVELGLPRPPEDMEIVRYAAQNSFICFCVAVWPEFMATKFHTFLADKLQGAYERIKRGQDIRLIIEAPPQHGKSTMVSELFPAWVMGKESWPVICASYGMSLAERKSQRARNIVDSDMFKYIFPQVRLNPDITSKEFWETSRGSSYKAVGRGGGLTGNPGKLMIADDLLADKEEANSQTIREGAWDWWNTVFYTRKQQHSGIILVECLTADTKVLMNSGCWKNINQIRLRGGENKVISYDLATGKPVVQEVKAVIPQGLAEVFELTTPNQKIRGTGRHPFLLADGLWVKLEDLKVGDYIVNFQRFTGGDGSSYTEEDLWMLGFMFGDGWITDHPNNKGSIRYATCVAKGVYPELNNRVLGYFRKKFGTEIKETKFGYYRTEVADVGRWFKKLGFKGKAKTKRIPWKVFAYKQNLRQAFLDGFTSADGHLDKGGLIRIGLCNKNLVEDVKLLALGLGYKTSNIYKKVHWAQPPHSPKPFLATSYHISIGHKKVDRIFGVTRVEKIEKLAKKERVYDLTVEGSENFIANGLVVHNTRWHLDDPAGKLEAQEAQNLAAGTPAGTYDTWEKITFPAISEADEMIDGKPFRKAGEALCPERFTLENLIKTKNAYISAGKIGDWAALYMQQPIIAENAEFKRQWFKYYEPEDIRDKELFYTTTVDLAISQKKTADNTVIRTVAKEKNGPNWYLMMETAGRLDPLQTIDAIFFHWKQYRSKVYVESVAYQAALQYFLLEEMRKRNEFFTIEELKVKTTSKKEERIRGLVPLYKAGVIWHRKGQDEGLELEAMQFPKGVHDDRLDALSMHLGVVRHAPRENPDEMQDGRLNWKKKINKGQVFDPHKAFNRV